MNSRTDEKKIRPALLRQEGGGPPGGGQRDAAW